MQIYSETLRAMTLVLVMTLLSAKVQGGTTEEQSPERTLRLEDLERLALENNPTIAQAEASVQAAEGLRIQAGLYPNPILGYEGVEFSRSFTNTSEHFLFLEQRIVTAGKLKKSRTVFSLERERAEAELEAQRLRVLNTVRLLYYEALGAQQFVELREELAKIARQAVGISEQLFNVGAADRPDVLEAEIEAQRAELGLVAAQNNREQVGELLAAAVGDPSLRSVRLEGNLREEVPELDLPEILSTLLRESPEIKSAGAAVERARATLTRAKAEPIPDIFVRGGVGYSFEPLEAFGNIPRKLEGFVEAGVRIPLFDRNQGNITRAQAEISHAQNEVQRLKLALRARLASVFSRYSTGLKVVQRYQNSVLPQAQSAYELYLRKFQQMAAAYPQVLIAQRTFFQVRVEYVRALVELWQNVVQIRGMLLTGGLNPPGEGYAEMTTETGEMPGLERGMQNIGQNERDD